MAGVSIAEYNAMRKGQVKAKKSKYNNTKVEADTVLFGTVTFDSKKEFHRYLEHEPAVLRGEYKLRRQVKYEMEVTVKVVYIADYVKDYPDGKEVVEDVKGYLTKEYKRKKKYMKQYLGIDIQEV